MPFELSILKKLIDRPQSPQAGSGLRNGIMVMMMVSMSKMHGGLSGMIGLNGRLPLRLIGAIITGMMDGTMLKQLMRCF